MEKELPGFMAGHFRYPNSRKCSLRHHVELVDASCVRLRRVDDVFAGEELPYGAAPQDAALVVELYDACVYGPGGADVELAVVVG